jgi:hypothetical protein
MCEELTGQKENCSFAHEAYGLERAVTLTARVSF